MDTYEKKIREYLNNSEVDELYKNMLLNLFPELRESEDEKVRKALAEMVHDTTGDELWVDYNVHKEEALAWLEKQGEYANFRNKIQVGDKVTRNRDGVLVNLSQLKRVANPSEKQGEQNPAWSEEDELVVKDIEEAITNYWHGQTQEDLLDRLKSLKQRIGG